MTTGIHEDVLPQLEDITVNPDRPLIITDADEVLFAFMQGMELFLEENDLFFDWASFALHGNIRKKSDQSPLASEKIPSLLDRFFAEYAHRLPAVEGAAEHLKKLSETAQIVVLSNVPPKYASLRKEGLVKSGMDFPLIANIGAKGHVVNYLTKNLKKPSFFIDDIPTNHGSVRKHAQHVHRLHYIADARLAKLLGPAEHSTARLDSWPELHDHIQDIIDKE
ncbi:hypothetical protein A9Q83_14690 [Alphaproteobacteria bacterium 46_93_T64]|nr:hypothetical protein A9Q83_14690 [Alphaproteobacteria bacterium 46_93_T64]